MSGKKHIRITDIIKKPIAVNLFASAGCNLSCKYCYIPKNKNSTSIIHHKILENIKSGLYFRAIEEWFDLDNIVAISHWGAEPTLTLLEFIPFYEEVFTKVPSMKSISFSTNLVAEKSVDAIIQFAEHFADKDFSFDIQISLDGPKEFTDTNRCINTFDHITQNTIDIINKISKSDKIKRGNMRFNFNQKSTITREQFAELSDMNRYIWYLQPFINIFNNVQKIITDNNITNVSFREGSMPTIIYPDNYMKLDGCNINQVCKNSIIYKENNKNTPASVLYYNDYCRFVDSLKNNNIYNHHDWFLCSAGNNSFGFDENLDLVMCHHSFYITNDEFLKESKMNTPISSLDITREGLFNDIKITNNDSEEDIIRKLMLHSAHSEYGEHKFNTATILILNLADSGLISDIYKTPDAARLLAMFISTVRACQAENIMKSGTMYIPPLFLMIAFGNGLFETLKEYYNSERRIKNDKSP